MNADAHASPPSSTWTPVRRDAAAALLRALDLAPSVRDPRTRAALHHFVDVLAGEDTPPQAVVIALKEMLSRVTTFARFEPLLREQMRGELVSASIDRYFTARQTDDVRIELRDPSASPRVEPATPREPADVRERTDS